MFDPSSFANPTPLTHADTSRDVLPRGGTSQGEGLRKVEVSRAPGRENAMANAFWVSVRNSISKRWNTTENDVSKNQSSADSVILQLDFRIQAF
ncbi:hypothetical protein TNCV_1436851 [Trichonephila clavipes]|nr:hypothetical protein TNCV_1436851 [Trichonephila clavipes]